MSSSFGKMLTVTIFGQSHGEAIGAVIDGLPAGIQLDFDEIERFMARRAPGGAFSTARRETDRPRILSGLCGGATCGAPLCAVSENGDRRSQDYEKLRDLPRPMHADYPAFIKYHGANDIRGGGQFSGRLTAPLCFAGAAAIQLLARKGVTVGAHIAAIHGVEDTPFDPVSVDAETLRAVSAKPFPVLDEQAGGRMKAEIEAARRRLDSVGGIVECAVSGLPAGLGEPLCESLESRISSAVFSIPAVKGIEFGAGFSASAMTGSEHNDPFVMKAGRVATETNRHGGVLGGISTGMPLLFRAAFKPTPSIALEQRTVSLSGECGAPLVIHGRHDPCVVLRAVPCVEAAAALVLLDLMLESKGRDEWN